MAFTLSAPGVRFGFTPNVKTWPRRTSPKILKNQLIAFHAKLIKLATNTEKKL